MTTYTDLLADIALWAARDDLAAASPAFVRLAEAEIGRVVRALEQETDTTLTVAAPNMEVALPDGFLGFKHVFLTGANDPRTQYLPPTQFHELKNGVNGAFDLISGGVYTYTIESGKLKGQAEAVLNVTYLKRFAAVQSAPGGTNWLLTNHYDVYLWGALKEAWDYIDETEQVAKYQARFDRAVGQLDTLETRKRIASGPLVRRPPAAVF